MAATGTETSPITAAESPLERARQAFGRLNNQQKILLGVALALLLGLAVAASTWVKQNDYRVLFSNISEQDGGAIIASLEQMNVPYRFSDSGAAILIPGMRVHDVRLRLAAQGLPKGGHVGFELLENQKFGISQFAEQVNYQRGLEGELSRTILSIGAVQAARVHLAIPKPSVFVREEQKPSASVLLKLHPGRSLDPAQIAGIQNLVAASVPNLAADAVKLIDQSGAAISPLKNPQMAGLDPTQIKYVKAIEAAAIGRVEDILSPILGPGNFRVQVAADIDFSLSEQTAETFRPNATPSEASIRSQQSSESASTMPSSAQGVPGALSNQPPIPATAPLTQPPLPGGARATLPGVPVPGQINAAGVHAQIANVGQPVSTRKDSTLNYELDRTIRHTKQSAGVIRRLTAAVAVNHRKDAKGVAKPLAESELQQINNLIREAIGFNQERGDSVSVANAPFTRVEKVEAEIPVWKDPEIQAFAKDILIKYLPILLIAAYLIFKIILPLLRTMLPPPPVPAEESARVGENIDIKDDEVETGPAVVDALAQKLAQAREIAQQNPKAVANIIKDWMDNGG